MKKETVMKLLILCGIIGDDEVNEYRYRILAEQDGRMEI